jgi:hypothetical protein
VSSRTVKPRRAGEERFDFEHLVKREGVKAHQNSAQLYSLRSIMLRKAMSAYSVFLAIGFFWLIASFLCLDISWFMLHSCQMFSHEM